MAIKIAKIARNCAKIKVSATAGSFHANEKFQFLFFLILRYVFYGHSKIEVFIIPR